MVIGLQKNRRAVICRYRGNGNSITMRCQLTKDPALAGPAGLRRLTRQALAAINRALEQGGSGKQLGQNPLVAAWTSRFFLP